jgi:hypothetical protein
MKTRKYFIYRIDLWDQAGENIVEHVAGIEDFDVAMAAYRAAIARWPKTTITPTPRRAGHSG